MTAAQQQIAGFGQAAPLYRKTWEGVLPLAKGTKWPPPEGYTGYAGGWPDGRQMLAWAGEHRGGNIALRLPHGIVGIDVDRYGSKRGDDTLTELEQRYGPLPPTWSSTSRGPGPSRIHLYRCPEDLKLPGAPGPSIEAIQFHHRYVVVWPSVVEGRRYHWYDPDGNVVMRPPKPAELAWLPEDWHRLTARPREAIADYQPRAVDGDWSKAVAKYHSEGVAGLRDPGGRHDAMLPVIMTLVRLDHDGHPGSAEALDDLRCRFVVAVGDRSTVAQAESEWQRMEDGAEAQVVSTPSQRGSYEDLKARSAPAIPPRTEPIGDFDDREDTGPEDDEEEPDDWDDADLRSHTDGTFVRPAPSLLKRTT